MPSPEPTRVPSQRLLRVHNAELVLKALIKLGPATVADLASETGLARGTAYSAVSDPQLLRPLLTTPRDVRLFEGHGGRPARFLSLKPYVALGVDLEHDRVRVLIADIRGQPLWTAHADLARYGDRLHLRTYDPEGKLVDKREHPSPAPVTENVSPVDHQPLIALDLAAELAEQGLRFLHSDPPSFWPVGHEILPRDRGHRCEPVQKAYVVGIGVSVAAPVNVPQGAVAGHLANWRDIKPAAKLRQRLALSDHVPLIIDNDANAGAWAEYGYASAKLERTLDTITSNSNAEVPRRYGFSDARPPKSLLYITTAAGPQGIGAGIVADGTIYRGAGFAGELGHVLLHEDASEAEERLHARYPCTHCDQPGCLQARTDVRLLLELARARGSSAPDASVPQDETWDKVLARLQMMRLDDRLRSSEAEAVAEAGRRLGRGLGTATTLLNPDVIVLGGPLSAALSMRDQPYNPDEPFHVQVMADPGGDASLQRELRESTTRVAYATLTTGSSDQPAIFPTQLGWWTAARGAASQALELSWGNADLLRRLAE